MPQISKPIFLVLAVAILWPAVNSVAASPFIQLGPRKAIPPAVAKPVSDLVLPQTEPAAREHIDTVVTAEGFAPSDAARTPSQLSYVRFGDLTGFSKVAECQGLGVGAPKLWIETLLFDLHPDPSGIRVATTGQFQVLLTGLISGKPFKMACHSRGVLEAEIRAELSRP